ncbi:HRDC domain-containing protein, partial [bacterium]|nr:HRDC domain-containing protein [bacterium]
MSVTKQTETYAAGIPHDAKKQFRLIANQDEWDALVEQLQKEPILALDIESNGYYRYPDRICLIQIGLYDQVYLLDPLVGTNLKGLGKLLANPAVCKVFHSCENDLRALDRDFSFRVKNLFDTAVAAHFLGSKKLGLSNVLQEFLGVELPKSKSLQRQDWTCRPLEQKSLVYAAGDVCYLLKLKDVLLHRLQHKGRDAWALEEVSLLEKLKSDGPVGDEALLWSVKGSRKLNDKERAVLQQVAIFREKLCREMDRAPFRVMGDDVLIALARSPEAEFKNIKGLAVVFQKRRQSALHQALKQGRATAPIPLQKNSGRKPSVRKNIETMELFTALKSWRAARGKNSGLDPALLWPMSSLERLANYQTLDKAGNEVRTWQKQEFEQDIEKILNKHKAGEVKKSKSAD